MRLPVLGIGACVGAAAALCMLIDARQAAGAFPGANGVIVTARCDDGISCRAQHLWTVDPRSGVRLQLTSGSDRDEHPSFSADGRRIAFDRCPAGGRCRIATVDVTGGNETDLTGEPPASDDESPSFSPDGSRIVFTRGERGGRHLFVMDADGRDVTRLTRGPVQDRGAVYSPDGASIVFERYQTGVGFRIHEIAAGGAAPVRLTSGPADYSPDVAPDGSRIAFGRRGAIWVMNADGRRAHALTAPPAGTSDAQPTFSPDASRIVFDRRGGAAPAGQQLRVMHASGSAERPITPASDFFHAADWRPLPGRCPARLARSARVDELTGTAGSDLFTAARATTASAAARPRLLERRQGP